MQINQPDTATLSGACQAALNDIRVSYDSLQKVIEELPPSPDVLLPGQASSANGRVAAGGESAPDITIAELNGCSTQTNCATKVGCACGGKVTKYYGQLYGPDDDFWLVETGGKKYYVWRGYSLTKEVWGYCPVGQKQYIGFQPIQGVTAGAAFADAGQKFVFEVGLVLATGGASTVTEEIAVNVADAFVTSLAESNGDWEKFQASLGTNLLFSSVGLTPEAAKGFKKFFANAKPYFGQFTTAAAGKLASWKASTGWISEITIGAARLTPAETSRVRNFLTKSLDESYQALLRGGATLDRTSQTFKDKAGTPVATFIRQGKEQILKPLRWVQNQTDEVIQQLTGVKYIDENGNLISGNVDLVGAVCGGGGGRVAAGSYCNLGFRRRVGLFTFSVIKNFNSTIPGVGVPDPGRTLSLKGSWAFAPSDNYLRNLAEQAKVLGSEKASGAYIEAVARRLFNMEGYVPVSISYGSSDILKYKGDNGFDEIAFKPGIDLNKAIGDIQFEEIIIIEAKPKNPSISLGEIVNPKSPPPTITQMSDAWIQATAQRLIDSGDPRKAKLGRLVFDTLEKNRSKLKKAVIAVNKQTTPAEIVVQKLTD